MQQAIDQVQKECAQAAPRSFLYAILPLLKG